MIRTIAAAGLEDRVVGRTFDRIRQRLRIRRDDERGAVAQAKIDRALDISGARGARLLACGEREDHAAHLRARSSGLRAVVVVIRAIVERHRSAADERMRERRHEAHEIAAGSEGAQAVEATGIAEARLDHTVRIRARAADLAVRAGGHQFERDAAEAAIRRFGAGIAKAVVVGICPHRVPDGDSGEKREIHRGVDLRVITIHRRQRLGARHEQDNGTLDLRARSAGLRAVVVIVHAVVARDH